MSNLSGATKTVFTRAQLAEAEQISLWDSSTYEAGAFSPRGPELAEIAHYVLDIRQRQESSHLRNQPHLRRVRILENPRYLSGEQIFDEVEA